MTIEREGSCSLMYASSDNTQGILLSLPFSPILSSFSPLSPFPLSSLFISLPPTCHIPLGIVTHIRPAAHSRQCVLLSPLFSPLSRLVACLRRHSVQSRLGSNRERERTPSARFVSLSPLSPSPLGQSFRDFNQDEIALGESYAPDGRSHLTRQSTKRERERERERARERERLR